MLMVVSACLRWMMVLIVLIAMNGLDDLRGKDRNYDIVSHVHHYDTPSGWTLTGAIQNHIDVYVSQSTFHEVQRSFPYLVSKEFASGGGDVGFFSSTRSSYLICNAEENRCRILNGIS
jgi:hypothetical protein